MPSQISDAQLGALLRRVAAICDIEITRPDMAGDASDDDVDDFVQNTWNRLVGDPEDYPIEVYLEHALAGAAL